MESGENGRSFCKFSTESKKRTLIVLFFNSDYAVLDRFFKPHGEIRIFLRAVIEHAAEGVGAATEQLVKRRSAADDQLRRLMLVRQAVVQGIEIAAVPRGKTQPLRERAVYVFDTFAGGDV